MTFVWVGVGVLLLIIVVITLVDIVRRCRPVRSAIGWSALVVLLPFVGSIAYWAIRQPNEAEVEQERLAEEDLRREAARRPIGR
jgi:hypothetical protein